MSTVTEIDGIVVYTDGSARPNPGYNGSGVHGYTYIDSDKPTKIENLVTTQRGYSGDKQPKDPVAVISYIDCYYANSDQGTNNLAEINAVLTFFKVYEETIREAKRLHFNIDSQYVLNCMTDWLEKWDASNWTSSTGKPVSNQEELKELLAYLRKYKDKEITYSWVKGHVGEYGNTRADFLSVIGTNVAATKSEPTLGFNEEPAKTFNKSTVNIHPLLSLRRLYFNSHRDYNRLNRYFQTGWRDTEYIVGKRTPDAIFSVVDLHERDKIIDEIHEAQYRYNTDFNKIVYARLDKIRSSKVYPWLDTYGKNALIDVRKDKSVSFVDNSPVISEVSPGELPMRAMETLNTLEEFLDRFKEEFLVNGKFEDSPFDYQATDITDVFYEGSSLKKDHKVGAKDLDYVLERNGKKHTLKLVFESDIPSRNTLKKLETLDTKVFLIHWNESLSIVRYVVGISTNNSVAVWSNYFANQILST